jgi:hypothetical protein
MKLVGDNAKLALKILRFSNPTASNEWDKKWLTVVFNLELHGFKTNYESELLIDDFSNFLEAIEGVLDRDAKVLVFNTLEESFQLKGKIDALQNIEWEGFLIYPVGSGNKLEFKCTSDFYQLNRMKDEIKSELNSLK